MSSPSENAERTRHPKVWIGHNPVPAWDDVEGDMDHLLVLADLGDGVQVRKALRELVGEYAPPQRDGHELGDTYPSAPSAPDPTGAADDARAGARRD